MKNNNTSGAAGERIACEYLGLLGYSILEKNYRAGHLEIDIIASYEGCVVFVEVKTRKNNSYGDALDAVSRQKIRNIKRAAYVYLTKQRPERTSSEIRLDVIAIDINAGRGRLLLRHLKGVI